MVFAWISQAIGDFAYKIGGEEKGQTTRDLTQLKTDKLVSRLIMVIPLTLLMFTSIFTPSLFTFGSILCQRTQWYDTNSTYVSSESAKLCPNCKPTLKVIKSSDDNRHFANTWCWNRLLDYDFEDVWEQQSTKSASMRHGFEEKNGSSPSSLMFHKYFPYVLLILTAVSSAPVRGVGRSCVTWPKI